MNDDPIPFDHTVWQVHSKEGEDAVRRGFEPEVTGHGKLLLLQLMTFPSFTSVTGWQIYQCNSVVSRRRPPLEEAKPRFIGCRTEWLQEEDIKRFSTPVERLQHLNRLAPTMQFQRVELDAEWLQSRLSELRSISITPFVESNTFGLDGERYEIVQEGLITRSRFNWWCEGPEEWQPLTTIVFAMLEELEDIRTYDAATASGDEVVPFDQAITEIEQSRK